MNYLKIVFTFLLLFSCRKEKAAPCPINPLPEQQILGRWEHYSDSTKYSYYLNFLDTLNYKLNYSFDTTGGIIGTYSISNSTISFLQDNFCGPVARTYSFTIVGDTLAFSLISDTCLNNVITGKWSKK